MRAFRHHPAILWIVLVLLQSLDGQILRADESLDDLKKQYEAAVAETAESVTAFQARYEEELGKLREKAANAGDLDLVLAVKKEAEGFREGGSPPASQDSLRKLQKIYADELAKLSEEKAAVMTQLKSGYLASLKKLEKELTRRQQIEVAVEARREYERVERLSDEKPSPAPNARSESPAAEYARMEKKPDRKSDDLLADWLAGTVWKRGTGAALRFEGDGRTGLLRAEGDLDTGTYTVDEEQRHVIVTWSGGETAKLELADDQIRLNNRSRSSTWVRLDQHLEAVAHVANRGLPESERQLERRLEGTVWSRNHKAGAPFLYEFAGKGTVFLSIWGADWRNPKSYQLTGPRQLTIEDRFEVEISEDFSTWRGIDHDLTGILIRVD